MKKYLLGTTALIGALSVAGVAHAGGEKGGAMMASGPSVSVGGSIDFQAGFADQDQAFETGANSREYKFQNDTEVHVAVEGRSDSGLAYGAVIELNADISGDADADGGNADKTYIYLESSAGRFELGGNSGAQDTLKVDASSIARATGGIDGDWYDFVNTGATNFIIRPDLPAAHAKGTREDATKITYYTPRTSGVQVGISFTPDEGDGGTAAGFTGELNGDQENVFGLAANYEGNYDSVAIAASLTGEFGDAEVAGTEDVSAWAVGLSATQGAFSIAGSWADVGDSGLATNATKDEQEFWTLGAAYESGPFGVSLTYIDSEAQENEFTNLVLGADYQLAPGLVPYIEVSFFDLDQDGTTVDNDGSVVLVGAELSF